MDYLVVIFNPIYLSLMKFFFRYYRCPLILEKGNPLSVLFSSTRKLNKPKHPPPEYLAYSFEVQLSDDRIVSVCGMQFLQHYNL